MPPLSIAIIGTGAVGTALARAFAGLGHAVVLGARDVTSSRARALADETGARLTTSAEAVRDATLVVLAVPGPAAVETTRGLGDLGGAVLLDTTNAVGPGLTYAPAADGRSLGEQVADAAPTARVVKGFCTLSAHHMGDGHLGNSRIALFLAGDDPDAVATVAGLAEALHFEPVVVGGLAKARLTEAMAVAWISLARGGFGRGFAFGLLRDDDA
jgi:predicted dinucleotide-binding enzyme